MTESSIFQLSVQQVRQMIQHAKSEAEYEVCGLIGGNWKTYNELVIAKQIEHVPNVAADQRNRYQMEERTQVQVMSAFGKNGLEIIGIYHSHPEGPPFPSPTDIAKATYPDAIYLILCPHNKEWDDQNSRQLEIEGYIVSGWLIRKKEATSVKIQVIEE